ncbi:MAG: hypothetical protein ACXVEI_12570, partial [Actinomycetota bacterium]
GVCVGNFSIPGAGAASSLTLVGKGSPKATLNGNASGSVVTVDSSETVTFKNLLITNGNAANGGGIENFGTVNLTGTTQVNSNKATNGGGVYNFGTLDLRGNAQVNNNSAEFGGGIFSFAIVLDPPVTLRGEAEVDNNTATLNGGGIACVQCTVIVTGSADVNGNAAGEDGGGIWAESVSEAPTLRTTTDLASSITLSRQSLVDGNTAGGNGGGVFNGSLDALTMNGAAQVNGNTASSGGGVYNLGTLAGATAGVNVASNNPDDIAP